MKKLMITTGLAWMVMTAAYAAVLTSNDASRQSTLNPSAKHDAWISVTSAEQLVGRDLLSKDGKQAGRVDGIVIDLARGDAVYLIVGSEGKLDIRSESLVLPFGALQLASAGSVGPLTVNQTFAKIKSGTHMPQDRMGELGNPVRVRQIYEAYGVATPLGYIVPPDPARESQPNRFVLIQPDRPTLTGENNQTLARNVRGYDVLRANGDSVGEIDQIMLDTTTGHIAYVLLSSGGFLGIGNSWLPVPPEAITWSPTKNTYVLNDKDVQPIRMQAMHKSELPARVSRSNLEALYNSFNVKPY